MVYIFSVVSGDYVSIEQFLPELSLKQIQYNLKLILEKCLDVIEIKM